MSVFVQLIGIIIAIPIPIAIPYENELIGAVSLTAQTAFFFCYRDGEKKEKKSNLAMRDYSAVFNHQ